MPVTYIVSRWLGTKLESSKQFTRRDAAARALVNATRAMIWDNSLADTRRGHDVHHAASVLAREVFDGRYRAYFDERPTLAATGHTFYMRDDERKLDRVAITIHRDAFVRFDADAELARAPYADQLVGEIRT